MKKLNLRLRNTNTLGVFRDSRKDIATLAKVFNAIHDKVNELIDENSALKSRIKKLEDESD